MNGQETMGNRGCGERQERKKLSYASPSFCPSSPLQSFLELINTHSSIRPAHHLHHTKYNNQRH